jgi:hypothetical protein
LAYIPVFGHEVNENVFQEGARDRWKRDAFPAAEQASWGKPKKQIQAAGPTLVTESASKVVWSQRKTTFRAAD